MSGYNYMKSSNNQHTVLPVSLNNEFGKTPTRNNPFDAGLDLYAAEDVFIEAGATKVIKTGISVDVLPGYVGKIEDRSSMAAKGLRTGGGVIDSGYKGEVGVVIHNINNSSEEDPVLWRKGYKIKRGDKIAQLLVYKVELLTPIVVNSLGTSSRGSAGFGSSGR